MVIKLSSTLKDKKLIILDCDGVLWRAETAIPGAADAIRRIRDANRKVVFLTNNSTKTRKDYVKKMRKFGIEASEKEIITSAYAASIYIRENFGEGVYAYVIGEKGLYNELKQAGVRIASEKDCIAGKVEVVVVGLDRGFNYRKLRYAMEALKRGAKFIATNMDPTLPTPKGEIPGAGSMVMALSTCSGRKPDIVIGKPNPAIVKLALKIWNANPSDAIIVGDRLDTDIAVAKICRCTSVLVLTGVTKREHLENSKIRPDIIVESIADLPRFLID